MISRVDALPLRWRLLLPFVLLTTVVGAVTGYLVVRDLGQRVQRELDQRVTSDVLDLRAALQDRASTLARAATLAANVEGMAEAVVAADVPSAQRVMTSVLALEPSATAVTITVPSGEVLATVGDGARSPVVDASSDRTVLAFGGEGSLIVTVPICLVEATTCTTVGHVSTQGYIDDVVAAASTRDALRQTIVVTDDHLRPVLTVGDLPTPRVTERTALTRQRTVHAGVDVTAWSSPLDLLGQHVGTVTITVASDAAFAGPRSVAWWLGAALSLVALLIGGTAWLVTRRALDQVRALQATSQRLGDGDLSARAAVLGEDELGQLATVLNGMAERVQAAQTGLAGEVAARTAEIEDLLQQRTEFFASLSHELRTPLAVILGQARMAADPRYLDAGGLGAWRTVEVSAEHLLAQVNAILDIARADSGALEFDVVACDIEALLRDLVPEVEALAAAAGVDIDVDSATRGALAACDPARLRQVLLNLIDNAVKYTPPGGEVAVHARRVRTGVAISVRDTGIGVPAAEAGRIYEPFYRVPGAATQRGEASTGLGLALALRLTQSMGGTLQHRSSPRGTTFEVRLPGANGEPRTAHVQAEHSRAR